jgi:cytochrome oxidase Cu insertion factor (SCO1/SenC/PrrC family)
MVLLFDRTGKFLGTIAADTPDAEALEKIKTLLV